MAARLQLISPTINQVGNPQNKEELVKIFYEMAKLYRQLKEKYRQKAFRMAAMILASHEGPIPRGKELRQIHGIGKSTAECIEEWLQTGKIQRLEEVRRKIAKRKAQVTLKLQSPEVIEKERVLKLFKQVHGVGPKTAEIWYQRGWRSIQDLEQHLEQLTHAQKASIKNLDDLQEKVPRSEIDLFKSYFEQLLPNLTWMICGSYRRGVAKSGDIDLLLMEKDQYTLAHIVQEMKDRYLIIEQLSLGAKKFMGMIRLSPTHKARRIDILWVPEKVWPFATLYFTGSGELNIQMRQRAISLGMSLNEYSLTCQDGKSIQCQTEREIFAALKMAYLSPTSRSIV